MRPRPFSRIRLCQFHLHRFSHGFTLMAAGCSWAFRDRWRWVLSITLKIPVDRLANSGRDWSPTGYFPIAFRRAASFIRAVRSGPNRPIPTELVVQAAVQIREQLVGIVPGFGVSNAAATRTRWFWQSAPKRSSARKEDFA
jgi:hypothetical protein